MERFKEKEEITHDPLPPMGVQRKSLYKEKYHIIEI